MCKRRWLCRQQSNDSAWQGFDCNWVGNFLYPTSMRPRPAERIHDMNKDEWFDSLTLAQAWAFLPSHPACAALENPLALSGESSSCACTL